MQNSSENPILLCNNPLVAMMLVKSGTTIDIKEWLTFIDTLLLNAYIIKLYNTTWKFGNRVNFMKHIEWIKNSCKSPFNHKIHV